MTCTCGHHEHAHAQDVGMCGSPHGCDCNTFRKAPAVHDGLSMSIHHDKATQDAEWLAGSEADTGERNLAKAYLALKDEVAGFEAMWEARERAHDAEIARIESDLSRSRDAHNAAIRERDTYRAWWLKVQDIAHAEREGRIKAEQGNAMANPTSVQEAREEVESAMLDEWMARSRCAPTAAINAADERTRAAFDTLIRAVRAERDAEKPVVDILSDDWWDRETKREA